MKRFTATICLLGTGIALIAASECSAQSIYDPSGQQLEFNLFQNFHTGQGPSQTTAAMYPAPHPVPYWVGGSHYTYQPLYPHQHMYEHKKAYYNYYGTADQYYSDNQRHGRGGDALNNTTVIWKSTGYHFGNLPFSSYHAQKFIYALQARKYGLRAPAGIGGGIGGGQAGGACPPGTCQ